MKDTETPSVVIIGGFGHVGLPLGLVLAHCGFPVTLYDIDKTKGEEIRQGKMPFIEHGADPILKEVLENGKLDISTDPTSIKEARYVVIAIGTPVDEYLNPKTRAFLEAIGSLSQHFNNGQTIIIRSTIYPHTCAQLEKALLNKGITCNIAYCPERIAQGYAIKELVELPQVIAGVTEEASDSAEALFSAVSPKIIRTSIGEAELVKLFSNAWRYIQFATTNQFYMIANSFGIDYNKVRYAMKEEYGRAATLPTAGFAAGPCLLKDTMQLSAFYQNNFMLGHSAMLINEGLPGYIVENLRKTHNIAKLRIGILGMAFKAETDDIRDSLSYKLGKILRFHGVDVIYSDEYHKDPTFVSKEVLLKESDIVIVGVPHKVYNDLEMPSNVTEVIDLWGIIQA